MGVRGWEEREQRVVRGVAAAAAEAPHWGHRERDPPKGREPTTSVPSKTTDGERQPESKPASQPACPLAFMTCTVPLPPRQLMMMMMMISR